VGVRRAHQTQQQRVGRRDVIAEGLSTGDARQAINTRNTVPDSPVGFNWHQRIGAACETDTALHCAVGVKRVSDALRVGITTPVQAIGGLDRATMRLCRRHDARVERVAVNQDRAGAAVPGFTADFDVACAAAFAQHARQAFSPAEAITAQRLAIQTEFDFHASRSIICATVSRTT